jgi:hypothetical protein
MDGMVKKKHVYSSPMKAVACVTPKNEVPASSSIVEHEQESTEETMKRKKKG